MSQKPKTPRGKRGTYTRVITRTTSESLRLVEPEKLSGNNNEPHIPANLTLPPPQKPASSFVVTSVVHSRADGGTDSPEDESRSDDISRVTDLETPSCSEETYSREVDEEGASVSFTEPPVPSEGHTVVTVPSVLPSTHIESAPMDIQSVSAVPQQIQGPEQDKPVTTYADDVFIAKCNRCIGRFQVVKVESIVPFHRGRWTCHDYLDNSKHAPEDGWVFYKERFVKKSELAEIKILEEQNISAVITSTVTTVTAPQPHHFEEVCHFKTYSTNIPDNSCITVQSNMNYSTNPSQPGRALDYTISGQATQYQAPDQKYFPVATTIQQQIFANQSAITSPSIENAPNVYFQPQNLLPAQPYINQPEYYGSVPYTPQPYTSTHTTNVNEMRQSTLENEKNRMYLQGQNVFLNQQQQPLMTSTIASAPVQSHYQITPQNQMFMSQSEPPSAQGPSVPMNPFIFPQVTQQVPNPNIMAQPTYLDSQRNQNFPMQAGNNIIPSTISYQHNILQNAPVYQSTVMTVTSSVQAGQHSISTITSVRASPSVHQTAGVNTAQVYQNQNVSTTEPLQNVVNSQISAPNIKPVPMQFVALQENMPSILNQQVQGSVIQTPPQTPTSFPVQTLHGVPLQSLHVQASIMNTPPQTPITDQPILENSTVLPSQHLASSIPASGDSIWIHPFSSTPCILSNTCYQFLPVVAYAPVINSQLQRQRYYSTPTLSYSWPSSPTYCARENENVVEFSDSETNEILAHVADYLDREKQHQRGGSTEHRETSDLTPVDNEDNEQYIVVVKKDKTSPLPTKETVAPPDPKKDSVDTINNKTPKSEPKININNIAAKSDSESLVMTTENVIITKSLVSPEDKVNEVEENTVIVDSIIQDNTVNAETCSVNQIKTSNLVDSEEDTVMGNVRFCLDNILQKTMELVEMKLVRTLSKEKHSKGPTISTLIDSDTGRVIIIGDTKSKTYIPPFSTSKPAYVQPSKSDYIKSMTFINKSYSGELQVSESVPLPTENVAETAITVASEIIEVDRTIDRSELSELPSPEGNLKKTTMEILISEESQESILQSCEDVLLSEHLEVASDSCDSQSDNTVIFRATLPLDDSNLNDTECDHSESNDLMTEEEITEDVSPSTPTQPESGRLVISLMSDDSDSFYLSSPEPASAAVSPQTPSSHHSDACSCLEKIHRSMAGL